VRAVVQRVTSASVTVVDDSGERESGRIERGLLVLIGVEREDGPDDAQYVAGKIRDLRLFDDPGDPTRSFDRAVKDVDGGVLVVSQFTLAADCRKGRRPAFDAAAPPQLARPLYEDVVRQLRAAGLKVATGEFQAMMRVALVNDGPVTLLLDSRKRF
jgi:D-tyrosyl-tRNA(Tyr) deacylase